jgi:integrase/recombinase XerD
MVTTFKAFLNERRQKSDGTYPLIIRITADRKHKEIPLNIYLKKEEWDKKNNRVILTHQNAKLITHKINQTLNDLQEAVLKFETANTELTLDIIADTVTKKQCAVATTFFSYANQLVEIMMQTRRIGNAIAYKNAISKLLHFTNNKALKFEQIDFKLLDSFTNTMLSKGTKINTVAIYMRELRAIYNKAIKEDIVDEKYYPFKKYKIKNARTVSRALTIDEMKKIVQLDLKPNTVQWHSRNYFLLSFCLIGGKQ